MGTWYQMEFNEDLRKLDQPKIHIVIFTRCLKFLRAFPTFFSKLKCQTLLLGKWPLEMQKCPYRDFAFLSSPSFSISISLIILLAPSHPLWSIIRTHFNIGNSTKTDDLTSRSWPFRWNLGWNPPFPRVDERLRPASAPSVVCGQTPQDQEVAAPLAVTEYPRAPIQINLRLPQCNLSPEIKCRDLWYLNYHPISFHTFRQILRKHVKGSG